MEQTFDTIETTLASEVAATSGTFTLPYPANKNAGSYFGGTNHIVVSNRYGALSALAGQISVAFGTSEITITNKTAVALAAGTDVYVQLDRTGQDTDDAFASEKMTASHLVRVGLGAPDTADPNGVCESQALDAEDPGVLDGALASSGVATFDVPRNVVAAWTNTAVITVTGTDEYGNAVVESSASGTSLAGKKAFKTVTAVEVSANVTGLTVGSGDVLGLPVFLPGTGSVLAELEDGAAPTAGTVVAGVATIPATATTGDVRGTYDPNSACNGSKVFELLVALDDPSFKGVAQFAG